VVKKICPIDVTLHKPQPKKVGNRIMTDKIKTKKSSCVLLKPVVLCRPLASSAAGETAFCDTKVTKKGRITVKTEGYDAGQGHGRRAQQAQARVHRPLEAQHLAKVVDPEVTQEHHEVARTAPGAGALSFGYPHTRPGDTRSVRIGLVFIIRLTEVSSMDAGDSPLQSVTSAVELEQSVEKDRRRACLDGVGGWLGHGRHRRRRAGERRRALPRPQPNAAGLRHSGDAGARCLELHR
jgi:hypothetical protein